MIGRQTEKGIMPGGEEQGHHYLSGQSGEARSSYSTRKESKKTWARQSSNKSLGQIFCHIPRLCSIPNAVDPLSGLDEDALFKGIRLWDPRTTVRHGLFSCGGPKRLILLHCD
jgi:hypothetical protein